MFTKQQFRIPDNKKESDIIGSGAAAGAEGQENLGSASDEMQGDDDDMIYPDNHLDDDDRYFLFPGANNDD